MDAEGEKIPWSVSTRRAMEKNRFKRVAFARTRTGARWKAERMVKNLNRSLLRKQAKKRKPEAESFTVEKK